MKQQQCQIFSEKSHQIASEFTACSKALSAMGDETRQKIILALMEHGCNGMRVGAITEKTYLSRPAVSHHLKILKEAGIINMERIGTKNYYYMDAEGSQWRTLLILMEHVNGLVEEITKYKKEHQNYWR